MNQRLFQKVKAKQFLPKHVAEVGVYMPETSNVYQFIVEGIRTTLVEPDPHVAAAIASHFAGNQNVSLHSVAVYDKRGKLELIRKDASTYAAVIDQSPAIVNDEHRPDPADCFIVEAVTFNEIDDGSIDLLSVDIEGGEWFVLKHMVSRPAVISIETHGGMYSNPHLSEIQNWMRGNGYQLWYKDKSDSVYVRRGILPITAVDRFRLLLGSGTLTLSKFKKKLKRRVVGKRTVAP